MTKVEGPSPGQISIAEIQEFAALPAGTQRYIRRSLDIGLRRHEAMIRWSRSRSEESSIRAQMLVYERLDMVRSYAPEESGIEALELYLAPLIMVSAFDLGQGRINDFHSYRFLYERLLGASARPWLPAAYAAAASLPHLTPERRKTLLRSMGEGVGKENWSTVEPSFYPQWIDKVDETRPAN